METRVKRLCAGSRFKKALREGPIEGRNHAACCEQPTRRSYRMVRTRWAPVKILAASGQTTFRADDLPAGAKYLIKPYAFEALTQTIKELAQA
jgi:hypothetical protein